MDFKKKNLCVLYDNLFRKMLWSKIQEQIAVLKIANSYLNSKNRKIQLRFPKNIKTASFGQNTFLLPRPPVHQLQSSIHLLDYETIYSVVISEVLGS